MLRLDPAASAAVPGLWACGVPVRYEPTRGQEPLPEPGTVLDPSWTLDGLKDDDTAAEYRALSWTVGIDPTKNRPSGEALARRVLSGKGMPSIHPLVDAYNLASAATLVPLSAYDLAHTRMPLTVRRSDQDEPFHGIGRDPEGLDKDRLVYMDAEGKVAGVFLWRDAMDTRVRPETERAFLMAVAADPVPAVKGRKALARAVEYAARVGYVAEGDPVFVP